MPLNFLSDRLYQRLIEANYAAGQPGMRRNDNPAIKLLAVYITHIRRKIAGKYEIKNVKQHGYKMTKADAGNTSLTYS